LAAKNGEAAAGGKRNKKYCSKERSQQK
jgi:hypothetical protein